MTSTKSNGQTPTSKRGDLRAKILVYLDKNVGFRVHLQTMASDLNEDAYRVQQAMNNIMRDTAFPLKRIVPGQVWQVLHADQKNEDDQKAKKPQKEDRILFEQVRELKNGAVLLEREDGVLFKAVELDFDNL